MTSSLTINETFKMALIAAHLNAGVILVAHMINLNTIFYTHVEHSPTKTTE